MVLTGLLGRSLRSRVRLPSGLPLVPRRASRVAELVLRALRFAVEVVGPVVTTGVDSAKLITTMTVSMMTQVPQYLQNNMALTEMLKSVVPNIERMPIVFGFGQIVIKHLKYMATILRPTVDNRSSR